MFQNLEEFIPEFEIQPPGADSFLSAYNGSMPQILQEDLSERLNSLLCKPNDVIRRYAQFEKTHRSKTSIDFDDLRIREWTEEEVQQTKKYMNAKSIFRSISVSCVRFWVAHTDPDFIAFKQSIDCFWRHGDR